MSLFNRDAKIIYKSIKQLELPKYQLFIHDDELCPCGSGKMFSNCCKNKPDSGPTNSPKPTEVLLMERMRKSLRKRRLCLHPDQTRCQGDIKEAHALQNHKIINCLNFQQSPWSNCIKCSNVLSLCSIVQEVYCEER